MGNFQRKSPVQQNCWTEKKKVHNIEQKLSTIQVLISMLKISCTQAIAHQKIILKKKDSCHRNLYTCPPL